MTTSMSAARRAVRAAAWAAVWGVASLAGLAGAARAAEPLRICASEDDLPYTNARGQGFEDRLAQLLGEALGQPVERVAFPDPRYLARDGLDKDRCDVMLGVDVGDPRMLTTQPYYRSSYVFISRAADKLPLSDWSSEPLKTAKLGVVPGTPAEVMLKQIGRYNDSFSYLMALGGNKAMRNRFVRYDVEKLVRDVAEGTIDVAVAWAPSVARYVKASPVPLASVSVPDARRADGQPVLFSYETSVGVRKSDPKLFARIETALQREAPRIAALLDSEGFPQLAPAPTRTAALADTSTQPGITPSPGVSRP